ncbi:hypothetical protein BKA64DRAFT_749382 [Cadophora sp. MPI-SDFR-AT-0126]|nr:hypothetical protein BKA64DRAFT_749382 [Leotiomycetes sp. MPI-SDFR-AT-0126]
MSSKNFVSVIPWDPTSEPHVERLRQQRMSCGWDAENVSNWRTQQLSGQKVLLWLTLKPAHPCYDNLITSHILQFPQESKPISDSGSDTFPMRRERQKGFTPIGHVSLDFPPTGITDPSRARIGATSLYLSPAIRGLELGNHVLKLMRGVGSRFARFAVMEVPIRESDEAVERFERFGDGRPEFSLADWYESFGWKRQNKTRRFVNETDSEGRVWKVELVGMEWDLWGGEIAEKPRL